MNTTTMIPLKAASALVVVTILLLQSTAYADSSIDWYSIDGGSRTSTNAQYSVSGIIGQPDAGVQMTSGRYSLTGGFWSLIAISQSPGAPTLTIRSAGPTTVVISWPSAADGFNLQQTSDLRSGSWSDYGGTYTDDGITKSVTVNTGAGNQYFRLFHP